MLFATFASQEVNYELTTHSIIKQIGIDVLLVTTI